MLSIYICELPCCTYTRFCVRTYGIATVIALMAARPWRVNWQWTIGNNHISINEKIKNYNNNCNETNRNINNNNNSTAAIIMTKKNNTSRHDNIRNDTNMNIIGGGQHWLYQLLRLFNICECFSFVGALSSMFELCLVRLSWDFVDYVNLWRDVIFWVFVLYTAVGALSEILKSPLQFTPHPPLWGHRQCAMRITY